MKTFEDSYTQVYMDSMYPQPEPIQLAAGPSATMSDAPPPAAGTISAIPQTRFEKFLEQTGLTLEQVGMELDKIGKVNIGGFEIGIRDFLPFVGSSEKDTDPTTGQEIVKQVGTPQALQKLGTGVGPMLDRVSRGTGFARQLDQDAKLAVFDLPTVGAALKPAAKVGRAAVKATKDLPVGLSIKDVSAPLKKVVSEGQVTTANFKNWFGDWQASPETASKVVDETGAPLAVYHGTQRPDRVGETFKKSRATSGPMAFFTDNPEVASGYAKGKSDTSLAYEDNDYAAWFKKKVGRSTLNLDQVGARMSQQEREGVIAKLRDINMTDDGEIVYQPGGGTIMTDSSFEYYLKREAGGNPLKAAKQIWLESGTLYNQEEKFDKVLQMAGVKGFDQDFPTSSFPAVYKVYLDIKNPLDTGKIDEYTIAQLEYVANKQRAPRQSGGADMWDKNMRDPKSWIAQLKEDTAAGKSSMVWTSIPDWVTKALKNIGYDGIKDVGGKMGGIESTVWIPFQETQVKSAMGNRGTFDSTKKNILRGAAAAPAAPAVMQDEEK